MCRFKDKVVLVTGGNRNTGLWLVKKFVDEGARVYACTILGRWNRPTVEGRPGLVADA